MRYMVYALQNAYLGAFDLPVVHQLSPEDMIESYRRLVVQDPERCYQSYVHEKTLCVIGEFDDITGIITPVEPKKIKELAGLFPAGFIAGKEAKTADYFDAMKKGATDGKPNPVPQN